MINYENTRKVLSYNEMMNIYNKTDNFDIVDEEVYGIKTRSFNYRLDVFQSFNQCGARNFRGTTFDIESKELLALPFYKFFNYNQSEFTLDKIVKTWKIKNIYEKVDGSLIFFYKVNGKLVARTQRRCNNIQSNEAMKIVNQNNDIKKWIEDTIENGYTPLFELLSNMDPHIVYYNNIDTICLLRIRNRSDGTLYMADLDILPLYESSLISVFPIYNDKLITINDIINDCKENIFERNELREGYVVLFENGELVKFKRPQYLSLAKLHDLHHTDTCIVEMLFNETLDDGLSEFKDNQSMLNYINNIIEAVDDTYNKKIKKAKDYYNQNKDLDRKLFAIKAQNELKDVKDSFGIAMELFINNGFLDEKKLQESFLRKKSWRDSKKFNVIQED